MGIGVKGREVMRWGSTEEKIKTGKRITQRRRVRRDAQRREDGKGKARRHDVSCPYGVMIFCYDYA